MPVASVQEPPLCSGRVRMRREIEPWAVPDGDTRVLGTGPVAARALGRIVVTHAKRHVFRCLAVVPSLQPNHLFRVPQGRPPMRRLVLLFVAVVALSASPAQAITVRDIIELSRTGLSDEILLAIIDTERKVFPIDPATLKLLKDSGVSERVILAMVKSGRTQPVEPAAAAPPVAAPADPPEPRVIVIDHHDSPAPPVREVAVPVPVYVPVYIPQHGTSRPIVPFSTIGLPHSRLGLSSPPPKPTSDPPYWKRQPSS